MREDDAALRMTLPPGELGGISSTITSRRCTQRATTWTVSRQSTPGRAVRSSTVVAAEVTGYPTTGPAPSTRPTAVGDSV
jgi:hypothetical protein